MIESLRDIYNAVQGMNPNAYEYYEYFEDAVWELCVSLEDKEPGNWVERGYIRVTRTPHSYRVSLYPYAAIPLDQFEDEE